GEIRAGSSPALGTNCRSSKSRRKAAFLVFAGRRERSSAARGPGNETLDRGHELRGLHRFAHVSLKAGGQRPEAIDTSRMRCEGDRWHVNGWRLLQPDSPDERVAVFARH